MTYNGSGRERRAAAGILRSYDNALPYYDIITTASYYIIDEIIGCRYELHEKIADSTIMVTT